MTGELVYSVQGTSAQPMRVSTLAAAGLRERDHLQEWVLAKPEILGDDVLVVTSEFDQWFSKDGRDPDRLDILGLGADGRLVVAELKRDLTPDFVTMQSINYASRASRFAVDQLAEAYLRFHRGRPGAAATAEEAEAQLLGHAPVSAPRRSATPASSSLPETSARRSPPLRCGCPSGESTSL